LYGRLSAAAYFGCGVGTAVAPCAAWKTRHWPAPCTPGAQHACGLCRPAPPTLLICGSCRRTTRCGPGTTTRSPASAKRSGRRSSWATRGICMESTSGSLTTGRVARLSAAADCRARRSTTTGARSTRSFRQRRGCASHMRGATHSSRTRTGSRSGGRSGVSSGGAATRLRSAAPDWRSHSTSSGCEPWCHARSGTTCVRVP
jgi:hypothetical protein